MRPMNVVPQADQQRHHSLKVSQQPVRARMCGFGDKVPRHPRVNEEERRIPTADRTLPTMRRTEDPSPLRHAFD